MRVPQAWVNWVNAVASAAIGGAAMAFCQVFADPSHVDIKHTGTVALAGALWGIANHFRQPPTQTAQSAAILQSTPAGQIAQAQNAVVEAVASSVKAEAESVKENLK